MGTSVRGCTVAFPSRVEFNQERCAVSFSNPLNALTLVYCGSLASVHSHKPQVRLACLRRVARHGTCSFSGEGDAPRGKTVWAKLRCSTPLRCSFSGLSRPQPTCDRVANSLDCPCTSGSGHVALDRSSWKLPCRSAEGYALQPARVPSCPVPVVPVHHVLSQESVVAGRVFAESQAFLKISGLKLPVKAPHSSPTLRWASWSECVCVFDLLPSVESLESLL